MIKKIPKKLILPFAGSAALFALLYFLLSSGKADTEFIIGVHADNTGIMRDSGMKWFDRGTEKDVFSVFSERGVGHFAAGIKVSPVGRGSFEYVLRNFLSGGKSGLVPCAVLYLSDKPSSVKSQESPALWSLYPAGEKAFSAGEFAGKTVQDFKSAGVRIKLYSIGCETDYGVCGVFAQPFTENNSEFFFEILKAAADAVKKTDSRAKIILSLARWYDSEGCADYISAARRFGIDADYAGLSFYPQSCYDNGVSSPSIKNFIKRAEIISGKSGLPVIVTGASYPCFSEPGVLPPDSLYPVSEAGQRDWLIDILAACYESPSIKGFFYSSPCDYAGVRKDSALFSSKGEALAAMDAFEAFKEPVQSAFEYAEKAVSSAPEKDASELNAIMERAYFLLRDGSVEEAKFQARLAEYKAYE